MSSGTSGTPTTSDAPARPLCWPRPRNLAPRAHYGDDFTGGRRYGGANRWKVAGRVRRFPPRRRGAGGADRRPGWPVGLRAHCPATSSSLVFRHPDPAIDKPTSMPSPSAPAWSRPMPSARHYLGQGKPIPRSARVCSRRRRPRPAYRRRGIYGAIVIAPPTFGLADRWTRSPRSAEVPESAVSAEMKSCRRDHAGKDERPTPSTAPAPVGRPRRTGPQCSSTDSGSRPNWSPRGTELAPPGRAPRRRGAVGSSAGEAPRHPAASRPGRGHPRHHPRPRPSASTRCSRRRPDTARNGARSALRRAARIDADVAMPHAGLAAHRGALHRRRPGTARRKGGAGFTSWPTMAYSLA